MAGLGLGVQLLRTYGHRNFEIIEMEDHLGGTWWVNSYPGCGVDPEIIEYYKNVATKYDIEKHIRYTNNVESAHWDESSGTWLVNIKDLKTSETYQRRCKILVSAVGILSVPNECDIKGASSFQGRLFHTARWDHSFDWKGKELIVVGNGCRASQVVPAVTEGDGAAKKVTQFARQAQWVFERPNPEYSSLFKFTMRWVPFAMRAYRAMHNYYAEQDFKSFPTVDGAPIRKMYTEYQGAYIQRTSPAKYHDFLIPKTEVGCKRRVLDCGYLECLERDNVELVHDDPIQEIVEDGVRTKSGRIITADAIVMANGFQIQKPLLKLNLHGEGGITVAEHWNKVSEGAASSYFGTCLGEFPNYFVILGPNTASGHGSGSYSTECQINFILRVIKPVLNSLKAQRSILPVIGKKADIVKVKPSAELADIDNVQERVKGLIWSAGCTSWAVDEKSKRNTAMYPDFQYKYWLRSVFVAWKDFEFSRSESFSRSLAEKSSFGAGSWLVFSAGVAVLLSVLYRGESFLRNVLKL